MHQNTLLPYPLQVRHALSYTGGMAAQPMPVPRAVDREQRIAQGLVLVNAGHSLREAADIAGCHYLAIWKAQKRLETEGREWDADEGVDHRIAAKAAATVELGIERMLREIETVDPRYLAPWVTAVARIGGLDRDRDREAAGADVLAAVLSRLSGGATVEVAARISSNPPASAQIVPNTGQNGPSQGLLEPGCASPAHITPTAERAGEIASDSVQLGEVVR